MFGSNHLGPCTQNSLGMHGTRECPILTPFCPCCDTPAPPLHAAFAYSNWLPEDMASRDRKWGGDRENQVWEKWKTGKAREKGEAGASHLTTGPFGLKTGPLAICWVICSLCMPRQKQESKDSTANGALRGLKAFSTHWKTAVARLLFSFLLSGASSMLLCDINTHVLTVPSRVQSRDLHSFVVKPVFFLTNMCVLAFTSANTSAKACSGNREPSGHSRDERKVASE